jgi:arabinan endo-1,5-alpha-L-arabinosidase
MTLNAALGTLSVFGSYSDLNGQLNLASGEYPGVNLGNLGFTGSQNFSVSAQFNSVTYNTNGFTQFGIYVGTDSANVVRTGYINYFASTNSFGIRNNGGTDANDGTFSGPLAPLPGDNVIYTLSRTAGVWTATVQNLTNPSRSGALALNGSLSFLNASSTLHAGIFANNFWFNGGPSATATVDSFSANVIPEPSSTLLVIGGMALLGVFRFRRPNG